MPALPRRFIAIALIALGGLLPSAHANGSAGALIDQLGLDLRPTPAVSRDGMAAIEAAAAVALRTLIDAEPASPTLIEQDGMGRTPLMRAAMQGYSELVDLLLSNPLVRSQLDVRDRLGASAWDLSQMALPLTMPACSPDFLSPMRSPLWRPYILRSGYFWRQGASRFAKIGKALQAAGAQANEASARAAWRARCEAPDGELQALVDEGSNLLDAVTDRAKERLREFKAASSQPLPPSISPLPAIEVRSHIQPGERWPRALLARKEAYVPPITPIDLVCRHMQHPEIPQIPWGGEAQLTVRAEVQAGRVVLADIRLTKGKMAGTDLLLYQLAVQRALATYECLGDHFFESQFVFKVT